MFIEVKKLHPVGDQDIRLNAMAIAYTYPIHSETGGTVIRMTGGETFSIAGSQDDLEAAIYDALRAPRPQILAPADVRGVDWEETLEQLARERAATAAAPSPTPAAGVTVEPASTEGRRAELGDDPTASRRRIRPALPAAPDLGLQPPPAAEAADEELPPAQPETDDPLAPAKA